VADVADRMQVPADYPAAVAVLCLAGVVSRVPWSSPKRGTPVGLWCRTSGADHRAARLHEISSDGGHGEPLMDIQSDWRQQYEEELAEYEREKEEYELRRAAGATSSRRLRRKDTAHRSGLKMRPMSPRCAG
jgi:hypothetical protein